MCLSYDSYTGFCARMLTLVSVQVALYKFPFKNLCERLCVGYLAQEPTQVFFTEICDPFGGEVMSTELGILYRTTCERHCIYSVYSLFLASFLPKG